MASLFLDSPCAGRDARSANCTPLNLFTGKVPGRVEADCTASGASRSSAVAKVPNFPVRISSPGAGGAVVRTFKESVAQSGMQRAENKVIVCVRADLPRRFVEIRFRRTRAAARKHLGFQIGADACRPRRVSHFRVDEIGCPPTPKHRPTAQTEREAGERPIESHRTVRIPRLPPNRAGLAFAWRTKITRQILHMLR